MTNYIEREQDNIQWARQFNIANQLINNWARARKYTYKRARRRKRKGPAGIIQSEGPWAKLKRPVAID